MTQKGSGANGGFRVMFLLSHNRSTREMLSLSHVPGPAYGQSVSEPSGEETSHESDRDRAGFAHALHRAHEHTQSEGGSRLRGQRRSTFVLSSRRTLLLTASSDYSLVVPALTELPNEAVILLGTCYQPVAMTSAVFGSAVQRNSLSKTGKTKLNSTGQGE
jgi:hypothetical protein